MVEVRRRAVGFGAGLGVAAGCEGEGCFSEIAMGVACRFEGCPEVGAPRGDDGRDGQVPDGAGEHGGDDGGRDGVEAVAELVDEEHAGVAGRGALEVVQGEGEVQAEALAVGKLGGAVEEDLGFAQADAAQPAEDIGGGNLAEEDDDGVVGRGDGVEVDGGGADGSEVGGEAMEQR